MPKDTFFNLTEEKRQKVIRVAIDQFAELHYSNVTINGIVKAAGIPKGSFYQWRDKGTGYLSHFHVSDI